MPIKRVLPPIPQAVADGPASAPLPPGAFSVIVNGVQVNAGQTIDLGEFLAGSSNEQIVYIVNSGGQALPWSGVSVSGASWFAFSAGGAQTLSPNESSQITVGIAVGTTGTQTATVTLTAGSLAFTFYLKATARAVVDPPVDLPPAPIADLSATASYSAVDLAWTGSLGATSYDARYSLNPAGDPPFDTDFTSTTNSVRVDGLTNGATWYFKVRARNAAGVSAWSSVVSAMPNYPDPIPASNLHETAHDDTTVSVEATDPNQFTIVEWIPYRSTNSGGPYVQAGSGQVDPSYLYTGLSPGTTYYFVLDSYSSVLNKYSGYSNEVMVTTDGAPPVDSPPAQVTGLAASAITTSGCTLTWNAATDDTASYRVGRSTTSGGPYTTIASVTVPTVTASVTGLLPNTDYYFVVSGYESDIQQSGPNSTEVAVRTLPIPVGPPTGIRVSGRVLSLFVQWAQFDGAVSQNVGHATSAGGPWSTQAATGSSATISGLTAGTTYYVRVQSVDGSGNLSEWSDVYSGVPLSSGGGPGTDPLPRSQTANVWAINGLSLEPSIDVTENITPIVGTYVDGSFGQTTDARGLASLVSQSLSVLPSGKRALSLGHVGWGRTDMANLVSNPTPTSIVNDVWPGESAWTAFMRTFWGALTTTPNLIVLDEEPGSGGSPALPHWLNLGTSVAARAEAMSRVYASSALRRKLPQAMRSGYINGSLVSLTNTTLALRAWEQVTGPYSANEHLFAAWTTFVQERYCNALRRVAIATYTTARRVAAPKALNYADERAIWQWRDYNRWPYAAGNKSMTNYASVGAYLIDENDSNSIFGSDENGTARSKSIAWNQNIDIINKLRAQRWPHIPWFSRLTYHGDSSAYDGNPNRVISLLNHSAEMGHRDFIWFCPGVTSTEVSEFQGIVERIEIKPRPTRQLPPIAWDADEITTGAFTQTYADESDVWA